MHGHDNCSHGPARAWVMQPDRRWFARCDTCNVFRLWADYYEVYGVVSHWWWECEKCLLETVVSETDRLAEVNHLAKEQKSNG